MDNLTPSQEIDKALHGELVRLARPHIAKSNGVLSPLDYDPNNLSQLHNTHCVPGQVADIEVLDLIGNTVMEGLGGTATASFVEQSAALMPDHRRELARRALQDGQSLYVATTHDNLIDPAMGLGAVTNPLRREKAGRNDFETGIIVNKMLSVLQYQIGQEMIPCMKVLQWLCDRTYLSFPQSESFRNSGAAAVLPEGHVGIHNGKIKEGISAWLARGGVALGVAPSGSTHKWDDDGTRCRIPEVTPGTAKMMAAKNVHVLSLIMGLDSEEPFIEPTTDSLYQVKRWKGAHQIPRDMAKALNGRSAARDAGQSYEYQGRHTLGDIPLLRQRYIAQEKADAQAA